MGVNLYFTYKGQGILLLIYIMVFALFNGLATLATLAPLALENLTHAIFFLLIQLPIGTLTALCDALISLDECTHNLDHPDNKGNNLKRILSPILLLLPIIEAALLATLILIFFLRGALPRYKLDSFIRLVWQALIFTVLLWIILIISVNMLA